jgi:indolepyruvate ferredoxin oxidoreductase
MRERRVERGLIGWYQTLIDELCRDLKPADIGIATEIAALPMDIRGYGPVKDQALITVRNRLAGLTAQLRRPVTVPWPGYAEA